MNQERRDELMVGASGEIREGSIRAMLPVIFGPLDLGLDLSRYRK